eukprot:4758393-Prymnesium_polylepis.1
MWVAGMTIFIVGSMVNFAAFSFASSSILVPLEAVQLVVNVAFNKFVNVSSAATRTRRSKRGVNVRMHKSRPQPVVRPRDRTHLSRAACSPASHWPSSARLWPSCSGPTTSAASHSPRWRASGRDRSGGSTWWPRLHSRCSALPCTRATAVRSARAGRCRARSTCCPSRTHSRRRWWAARR